MLAISPRQVFMWLLFAAAVAYLLYELYQWWTRRQAATVLSPEEFEAGMRQAQVVDVREPHEFRSAHIHGARNVPYSQFNQGVPGFNRSQPLYLYDNGIAIAGRAAKRLKKEGYQEIYLLEGGFQAWEGKTKRRD